jgi:hypothetical protein
MEKSTEKWGPLLEQDSLWWKMRNAFQIGRVNQHQLHFTLMEDRAVYWMDTNCSGYSYTLQYESGIYWMFIICTRRLYTVINVNNLYWIFLLDSHPLQRILIICTRYTSTMLNINHFFQFSVYLRSILKRFPVLLKLIRCT